MKRFGTFAAGMAVMLLICSLAGGASAAGGQVEFNRAGISLFGEDHVRAGESYTAPNGQQVPSVITYVDNAGGKTNYLSVRQISELLNVDINWDAQKNRVNFGQDRSADQKLTIGTTPPEAGSQNTVHGPFTEIDPDKAAGKTLTGVLQDNTRVQTTCGYSTGGTFYPSNGNYIVLTVTNNGSTTQISNAGRARTLGGFDTFASVRIAPGETLTRAFYIADDAKELESTLSLGVYDEGVAESDITVSLKQYE
ncbi:hypothetical protein [Oscillibacter sp. 1-3]|uniref:hypothetical protein n=1 Tax=Oscillibacter sp. 1-3 TaxID=1235797 RepID=UPI0003409918|nr:hypothetical protein [Oscillibacter sp. 1-3]EOS62615.1 hypothetical protein C816_03963 [Oscillibacter sp. 1-3]MCX4372981.1 hypothetical protein [Dysosmobacter sp.]